MGIFYFKKNFLLHLNLRIYIDNTLTKCLYLYNLHSYNASLISIELQTEKMTNCLNLQRTSFKAFTRSVIICEIISSISFQWERAKIHYFAGLKAHKVIYFICVYLFFKSMLRQSIRIWELKRNMFKFA